MTQNGYQRNEPSYDDLLEQVNLGKKRSKLVKKSHYVELLEDYVSTAQIRSAQIRKAADTLGYDYVSLGELQQESKALTEAEPTTNKSVLSDRKQLLTAYKIIVNEHITGKKPSTFKGASSDFDVDWDKSLSESASWAVRANKARDEVEEQRVNVEMLWSEVQDEGFAGVDKGAKQAAEAKLSLDRIEIMRQQLKNRFEYLVKIGRVQGAGGKILDAVTAGAASFLFSTITFGIGAVEKEFNPLFYKGSGWTYHSQMPTGLFGKRLSLLTAKGKKDKSLKGKLPVGDPKEKAYKVVLMEDLAGKIKQVKAMLGQRSGGANALDWLSALLWFVGDGIVQALMAVGSRIAIWITGLSVLLHAINVAAHGALTPVIAVLTALALAITYVRMALAAVKVAITAARLAVDSLNLVLTKDPRMKQALKGRAIRSGVGLVGDAIQLGGFAVAIGGDVVKEGLGVATHGHIATAGVHDVANTFNPVTDAQNVAHVHQDVMNNVSGPGITSSTYWGGEALFGGGVAVILTGADALPAVGEAVSDTNDLNASGPTPYLGGSNQKSQGFTHEGMHGRGLGNLRNRPRSSQGSERVPTWMEQGKSREEEMGGQRAEYLVKEANKKVTVSQSQMADPAQKVGAASEKSQKVSDSLTKVKNFFSKESTKKHPDVPKEEIPEQQHEAEDNQQDAKSLASILMESVGAMNGFAA